MTWDKTDSVVPLLVGISKYSKTTNIMAVHMRMYFFAIFALRNCCCNFISLVFFVVITFPPSIQ